MRNAVVLSTLLLAACGSGASDKAPKAQQSADAMSETAMPSVVLPPSIAASKSFRCKDNSVVRIDFLSDDRSANVSTEHAKPAVGDVPAVRVEGKAPGDPMTGGGWTVVGGKADANVTVTVPGGAKALSCHTGAQKAK